MKNQKVFQYSLLGFFAISIMGTILNFTYEFFGNNLLIAAFSAVNTSVWEHVKIAVIPVFFWTIFEFCELMERPNNLWVSLLVKILTIMLVIITGFYFYTYILGEHFFIIEIGIFYFAIFLGQLLGYRITIAKSIERHQEEVFKYITIFIFLLFVIFTFFPPKFDLFKDEVTNTYGVFEYQ